ncbi:MAG: DUF4186 domain-containing protein [Dehalococcoidales bacterium]|nr:DUF4186 domain-containing protein [Dehalococcoidales bacterium]
MIDIDDSLNRLKRSAFRSRFRLSAKDLQYIQDKGINTIRSHAKDFICNRLSPAEIPNDGKQTPMRGHPVFVAQHATACCCRDCLYKWYRIPKGRELPVSEQDQIADLIMTWIEKQVNDLNTQ